jgi:heat shock protein HslJ
MKKIFLIASFLLALLVGTQSYGQVAGTDPAKIQEAIPDTSSWVLTRITGSKVKQPTGRKVFLAINKAEEKLSGYTSCNFIKGKIAFTAATQLSVSEVLIGNRLCDEATSELELALVEALSKVTSWKIEDGKLFLYQNTELVLELKASHIK